MSTFYVDCDCVSETKKTEDGIKHVGFVAEEPLRQHEKLCRKDTPHHTKNARINLRNSKADEERVAAILAQVLEKTNEGDDDTQKTPSTSSAKKYHNSVEDEKSISLPTDVIRVRPTIRLDRKATGFGVFVGDMKSKFTATTSGEIPVSLSPRSTCLQINTGCSHLDIITECSSSHRVAPDDSMSTTDAN